MKNEDNTMFRSIITGILLTAFGSSIGFGVSQMTVAQEFRSHAAEGAIKYSNLVKTDDELKEMIYEMKQSSAAHMREVIDLFKAYSAQNQELINLVKVQNEMLRQQNKQQP
jgi:hypothetical protein